MCTLWNLVWYLTLNCTLPDKTNINVESTELFRSIHPASTNTSQHRHAVARQSVSVKTQIGLYS